MEVWRSWACFPASSDECDAENAQAPNPAQVSVFNCTRRTSYVHGGGSCICRDRSARCRRWSVRTAAKCSGPCTADRSQRLQGQTCVAAPGTAVCHRQEMAAMCRCRLGCRIRLPTRYHRRRRPWRPWCIVDQPCMGDRILTPRGSPAYPMYTELRPPALREDFNLSYATSDAAAARASRGVAIS